MNIISIQSHVVFGHVGNSAAVFPLQRLGHEVWPIHTVQFSNHTGYGDWTGAVFDAGLIGQCMAGLAQRGALANCDGLISGYVGSLEAGGEVLAAAQALRSFGDRTDGKLPTTVVGMPSDVTGLLGALLAKPGVPVQEMAPPK